VDVEVRANALIGKLKQGSSIAVERSATSRRPRIPSAAA